MNNLVRSISLSAAAMALFACSGDDVTKVYETNNTTVGMDLIAEGDKLPDCDADHEGRLIFVADSSMAYYCSADKKWLPFGGDNWKGPEGEQGEQGEKGEKGEPGEKGKKGEKGDDGASCSAKKIKDGIQVSCGGTVIDTLRNGDDGESCSAKTIKAGIEVSCGGTIIDTLENGKVGESCTLDSIDGGVQITCGTDVDTLYNGANGVTTVEGGCTLVSDENGVVTFACEGGDVVLSKALCGSTAYDPDESFCLLGKVVALNATCAGESIDQRKQFCDPREGGHAYDYVVLEFGGVSQVWMAQNLVYGTDLEGASICSNGKDKCDEAGRLYDWWAAANVATSESNTKPKMTHSYYQGICPDGWHIPNEVELYNLLNYNGQNDNGMSSLTMGKALKSTTGWAEASADVDGNGEGLFGLNIMPSGSFSPVEGDAEISVVQSDELAVFWIAAEAKDNNSTAFTKAYTLVFTNYGDNTMYNPSPKGIGASVRCLMDI